MTAIFHSLAPQTNAEGESEGEIENSHNFLQQTKAFKKLIEKVVPHF
jgi:hypothetical protein